MNQQEREYQGKVLRRMGGIFLVILSVFFILLAMGAAEAQNLRQNPQIFIGTKTNVTVADGGSECVAVSVNATTGILMRIIVGGHDAEAQTSTNFDVRITQKAGCEEEANRNSIFQLEGSSTLGQYPFGLYMTPVIIFKNADVPAREVLHVKITNNEDSGPSSTFDIFLAGQKLDGSGT